MLKNRQNLTGNEACVLAAIDSGAELMFGYPITPATEILHGWINKAEKNANLKYLQTEDETSAGFGVIGAILAGKRAFTATAGPGHVLLQDPVSMAENLRLPFVGIVMQRGGPSTGTVNFSQQEVNLAAFGGNGDGLRIVYSASSIEEMYSLTLKAFSSAWKYRFPTFVLGDGYLGKMSMKVSLPEVLPPTRTEKILAEENKATYLRNCYSSEESFNEYLMKNIGDWNLSKKKITESENYLCDDASELIIAHGIVAAVVKEALSLGKLKKNVGLFRPITLHPFPSESLEKILKNSKIKKIYIIESALNQFSRIVKYENYGSNIPVIEISHPAIGFTAQEILREIEK